MPLDGIFLHSLIEELKPKIINGKIRKINQFDKYSFVLNVRCNGENQNLLISANSKYNSINLTNQKHEIPKLNFMFSTILKKYILNGKIKDISQIENDRILKLYIENRNDLGDVKEFELIIELMGKHSNVSLVEKDTQKVLDSIKHLSLNNNSYRTLMPNSIYKYPPKDDLKLNPMNFTIQNFKKIINIIENEPSMYSKIFQGVSPQLSKFIFELISTESLDKKFEVLNEIFKNIKLNPTLYKVNNTYKDFYSFDINISNDKITKQNLNDLIDDFIVNKNISDDINGKLTNIKKIINSILQKSSKKISIFKNEIKNNADKNKFKLYGDLISSNIYLLKGKEDHITVQNYFSENLEEIKIPLNPKMTPSQNIEYYYKKFKKLKKSEEINLINISSCEKEIDYLNSVLLNLNNAQNTNDIDDIRIELGESGYLKVIKTKNKDSIIKSSPHHYVTSSGISIFVGKNNIQNESLTFKIAKKDYMWFHVKNIAGSHVILAHNNPNDKLIEIASMLAAFYSKSSSSSNVPVDYTKVKNVKKMPHAKPGMVIYTSYNTAYVTPPTNIDELNLTIKS